MGDSDLRWRPPTQEKSLKVYFLCSNDKNQTVNSLHFCWILCSYKFLKAIFKKPRAVFKHSNFDVTDGMFWNKFNWNSSSCWVTRIWAVRIWDAQSWKIISGKHLVPDWARLNEDAADRRGLKLLQHAGTHTGDLLQTTNMSTLVWLGLRFRQKVSEIRRWKLNCIT